MHTHAELMDRYTEWQRTVEAEFGTGSIAERLTVEIEPGLSVRPLYTELDGLGAGGAFLRRAASQASALRLVHDLRRAGPAERAALLERDFEPEHEGLWLAPADTASFEADLQLLKGPGLARTLLLLDGTARSSSARARVIASRAEGAQVRARAWFGADPLGAFAGSGQASDLDDELSALGELALVCQRLPGSRAVLVSSEPYSNAGASAAQEIGAALATGLTYLRVLAAVGIAARDANALMSFRFALGCDLFLEISKLRAFRCGWRRILSACGVEPEAARATLHASTAERGLTRRGRPMNALRVTVGCLAGFVGTADLVSAAPLEAAFDGQSQLGFELARNVSLILREEAKLANLGDPAAGSYYLEALSEELARAGWRELQSIESMGGMAAALHDGAWMSAVAAVGERRLREVCTRRSRLTGLSDFVDLGEPQAAASPPSRDGGPESSHRTRQQILRSGSPFEDLRDRTDALARERGEQVRVGVVTLGEAGGESLAFVRRLLELAGLRAAPIDRRLLETDPELRAALGGSRCAVIAVDQDNVDLGPAAVALRRASVRRLAVASPARPSLPHEAELWLHDGCDVVAFLSALLDEEEKSP